MSVLPPSFFRRDAVELAQLILGKRLVVIQNGKRLSGIINEAEAYQGRNDPASHAYRGITERNRLMHETVGHAYVYFIYGMYDCLNFTAGDEGIPWAVLIRSIIPDEGIEIMKANRNFPKAKDLANGPWKLCRAMGIKTATHHRLPLVSESGIFVEETWFVPEKIHQGTRIGINVWTEFPWRFWF